MQHAAPAEVAGLVADLHPLLLRVVQGAVSRDAESTLGDLWREAIDRVGLADLNALRRTALEVAVATAVTAERQRPGAAGERFAADGRWRGAWLEPSHGVPQGVRSASVETALAGLSVRLRLLAVLRDVEGWSPSQVTAVTGLDEERQADLLADARRQVADALEASIPQPVGGG